MGPHSTQSREPPRKWNNLTLTITRRFSPPTSSRKWVFCSLLKILSRSTDLFQIPFEASALSPANQRNARTKSCGRPIRPDQLETRGTTVCVLFCDGAGPLRSCHKRAVRQEASNGDAGPAFSFFHGKRRFLIRDRSSPALSDSCEASRRPKFGRG